MPSPLSLARPSISTLGENNSRNAEPWNKNDRIDARKLSDLLYMNKLSAVYHGERGMRTLKELARSYITMTRDLTRVTNRLKAIYRSWAIPCAGQQVYAPHYRSEWLAKISEASVRRRAELYYVQFDVLNRCRAAPSRPAGEPQESGTDDA
jgi:hypothetical protein